MKARYAVLLFGAAIAGAVTILREARRLRRREGYVDELPTLLPVSDPVSDAEPTRDEPLRPDQLHVAQNAPL